MSNKKQTEERDELGFTPSDYYDMQRLADKRGIKGDSLIGGFDITEEQIRLINSSRHPLHVLAVNCFYCVNFVLLKRIAYAFLRYQQYLMAIVDAEDLLQQLYCDMLIGCLKLPTDARQLSKAIYKCFKYAAVGGLEGVEDVKDKRTLRATA